MPADREMPAVAEHRWPLKSIRAVLFDAVGTLIYGHPDVVDVYHRLGSSYGSRLRRESIRLRFHHALDERHRAPSRAARPAATSHEAEQQRWRNIVADVFCDLSDTSSLFEDLWKHFGKADNWAVYDDAPLAWESLSERGLQIGIASNFDQRLDGIVNHLSPLQQTPHVFHSAALGVRKPAVAFFRQIERSLSLSPHEIVMVGDSYVADYRAAKRAGWHAFWLRRGCQSRTAGQLADLRELTQLIAAC